MNELGEDFQFEDETFDEATVQKLSAVASKWMNGVLSSAFNSWVEACKLLRVHTISIFECYRRNAAGKFSECRRFGKENFLAIFDKYSIPPILLSNGIIDKKKRSKGNH